MVPSNDPLIVDLSLKRTSQKAALGRQEFYAKLYEILCYLRFFHFALDGQKTELIFRCIDSQRGAALGRQKKFYAKLHNILC